ncbi:amidohydrolase, partial [bacterium]
MRITAPTLLLSILLASSQTFAADTIFYNGTIYTLADDQPSAVSALAIEDGVVVATGNDEQVLARAHEQTVRINLDGAWITPGLTDAHAHLYNLGVSLSQIDLRGTTSAADCVQRAREMESTLAPGEWLMGRSWDQNDWAVQEFPTRELLDEAFAERPVYLRRVDGHAIWVNSV